MAKSFQKLTLESLIESCNKSEADFNALLGNAIEAITSRKLAVALKHDETNARSPGLGKYVQFVDKKPYEPDRFWIGHEFDFFLVYLMVLKLKNQETRTPF